MAKSKNEKNFYLVGLDEAGRGALAGPVVACAVFLLKKKNFSGIDICDSKKLSSKKREVSYRKLIKHPDIRWGVGIVSQIVIDKVNIRQATKIAMEEAVLKLNYNKIHLVIDGDFIINNLYYKQRAVKGADGKVLECMMASIIAKVERDKIMQKYDKKYPEYGFGKHKGYGTNFHYEMLAKNGHCLIHRQSFRLF